MTLLVSDCPIYKFEEKYFEIELRILFSGFEENRSGDFSFLTIWHFSSTRSKFMVVRIFPRGLGSDSDRNKAEISGRNGINGKMDLTFDEHRRSTSVMAKF